MEGGLPAELLLLEGESDGRIDECREVFLRELSAKLALAEHRLFYF